MAGPNQLLKSRLNIRMAGAIILDHVFSGLAGGGELFEPRLPGGRAWGDARGQDWLIPPSQRGSHMVREKEDGRPGANRA